MRASVCLAATLVLLSALRGVCAPPHQQRLRLYGCLQPHPLRDASGCHPYVYRLYPRAQRYWLLKSWLLATLSGMCRREEAPRLSIDGRAEGGPE